MKRKIVGLTACMLAVSIVLGGIGISAKGRKKAALKTKKITLQAGKKKTIQLKNKKQGAAYTYKSASTKIAKVSKKGVITAVKAGKTKITVKEKSGKKTRTVGRVTVTVKATATKPTPTTGTQTALPSPSAAPVTQQPTGTPVPTAAATTAPADEPTISPTPAATQMPPVVPEINTDTPRKLNTKQDDVTYGTQVKEQYYSTTTGKDRNVIVLLPAGYTEEKKYPVLYLFHGGMGDENDWMGGNVLYMIGNMVASGEAREMIIVLPNCRCREDDSIPTGNGFAPEHVQSFDRFRDDFRDNLMPYIEEHYSVATGRENTAVAGFSMGGRVSLNIGISLADRVGYTGAFSPAYGIFPYTNNGLTEEGLYTEDTFKLPEEYNNHTFLLINTGNQDNMVSGEPARYHDALEKNGVYHTFYTLDGGHDWPVWRNGFYNFAKYLFQ